LCWSRGSNTSEHRLLTTLDSSTFIFVLIAPLCTAWKAAHTVASAALTNAMKFAVRGESAAALLLQPAAAASLEPLWLLQLQVLLGMQQLARQSQAASDNICSNCTAHDAIIAGGDLLVLALLVLLPLDPGAAAASAGVRGC
jgi:hypothetical protein